MTAIADIAAGLERLVRGWIADELRAARPALTDPDRLVPLAAWAEANGVTPGHARRLIREGRLDAVRVGRRALRVRASASVARPARRISVVTDARARALNLLDRRGGAR